MTGSAQIHIRGLVKAYAGQRVIDNLDLEVRAGELLTLLGASGSGKTTLLRMLAGLERADSGTIHFNETPVQDGSVFVPPQRRGLGVVFQNYALWPHLNVAGNLALALREQGISSTETAARVDEALQTVGLEGLQKRAIHQLSGGQQQRVALARALVARPRVLLCDEPLSNLDAGLREQLRDQIRSLQQQMRITTVFVTHDQTEALAMSDRIALLHRGRLVELDAPETIYARPSNAYSARFLGKANVMNAQVAGVGTVRVGAVTLRVDAPTASSGALQLMIRPEAMRWSPVISESVPPTPDNLLAVEVRRVHMLGALREYVLWAPAIDAELTLIEPSDHAPREGHAQIELPAASLLPLAAPGEASTPI